MVYFRNDKDVSIRRGVSRLRSISEGETPLQDVYNMYRSLLEHFEHPLSNQKATRNVNRPDKNGDRAENY